MSAVMVCGAQVHSRCEQGCGGSQPASPLALSLQCLEEVRASDALHLCFGGQMEFRAQACDHIQHTGPQQHSISEDVQFAVLLTVFLFVNDDPPVRLPSLLLKLWHLHQPSRLALWCISTALLLTAWSTRGHQEGPSVALPVRQPCLPMPQVGRMLLCKCSEVAFCD
ncbi:hypothetical protein HJG60_009546 [Phyllostomus discolor]|uniref:Uncharacterized protein n=1 Tax=Phyllostomus discolor TaxID=89673 RepID=A0A833Y3G8_9CHIR|nr:hypothetical protein HJG60_009546 [Phyllostomus discolor]